MPSKYFALFLLVLLAIVLLNLPSAEGMLKSKQYKSKIGKRYKVNLKRGIPQRRLKKPIFKARAKRGKVMQKKKKQKPQKRRNLESRAFETSSETYYRQPQSGGYERTIGHEAYHTTQQ